MKTKFIALAGLALVAAACNKENVPQVNENGRVTVSFNASPADTKVVYTENADAGIYNIDWSENEEVGLRFYNPAYLTEFSEFYKFTKGEGNKFTGEVEPLEGCDKVNVFACWPYDAEFFPVEGESDQLYYIPYVNLDPEDVQNIYPAGDEEYGHTLLLAAGADREYNKIGSLEFRQMCAILKMNITGVPAGAKVEKITIFTSGDVLPDTSPGGYAGGYSLTARYRINVNTCELAGVNRCAFLGAKVSGTENGQDCVVNFPLLDTKKVMESKHETGDKYRFAVTLSDGSTFEKTLTEKVMFEVGHVYKLNMPLQELSVNDLSVNDLSADGTANCYVVDKYGPCKFDATKKGHTSESVGTIASAEVLWESFGDDVQPAVGDIVKDVTVQNGIVSFTASGKDGNAVIAVKDANGDILWSWHIWVCKDFDPAATAQVYKNNAGTMMDRNLGATSATKGDVHSLGLLYQWGRKDPFLSGESTGSNTQAKSTITWPSAVSSDASNGTIDFVVKHPTTFVTQTKNYSNGEWYYTGSELTDNTRWHHEKGMYDPCPKGWKVPDGGTSGVWAKAFGTSLWWRTSSNWDSVNKGMDFGSTDKTLGSGSIWYPASGYLDHSDGSLSIVGTYGYYWSCTPDGYGAHYLGFYNDGRVDASYGSDRGLGRSVRCLAE